jgi:hypothetical protein
VIFAVSQELFAPDLPFYVRVALRSRLLPHNSAGTLTCRGLFSTQQVAQTNASKNPKPFGIAVPWIGIARRLLSFVSGNPQQAVGVPFQATHRKRWGTRSTHTDHLSAKLASIRRVDCAGLHRTVNARQQRPSTNCLAVHFCSESLQKWDGRLFEKGEIEARTNVRGTRQFPLDISGFVEIIVNSIDLF